MTALIIVLVIAFILFLPVSLVCGYDGDFNLYIRILFLKIPLTHKSSPKKSKPKNKNAEKPVKTNGESFLSKFKTLLDIIAIVCKRMHLAVVIKNITAKITVRTEDPCTTALIYGGISSVLYSSVNLLEKGFRIKEREIVLNVDYTDGMCDVYLNIVITTFLLRLLIFLILSLKDGTIKLVNKKEK